MAIFPKEKPRPSDSRGEIELYDQFKSSLPQDWVVWHSLKLSGRQARDLEADFVILDPRRGLLVVEVKSGAIELRDGRWFQNGREMEKSPRQQAENFAYPLVSRLKGQLGLDYIPFNCVVAFPNVIHENGALPDDLRGERANRALTAADLPRLSERLSSAFDDALMGRPPLSPDTGRRIQEHIHRLWGETWTSRPSLAAQAIERPVRLSETQQAILFGLRSNRSLLVQGGPGTGKSFLAREAAKRFADRAGVLYICFNDPLAKWMAKDLAGIATVKTIRRLAAEIAGVTPKTSGEWASVVEQALERIPDLKTRPRVCLLDEAQDLNETEWLFVEAFAREAQWWAFSDPDQVVLRDARLETGFFDARFELTTCYRSPQELVDAAQLLQRLDLTAFESVHQNHGRIQDRTAPVTFLEASTQKEVDLKVSAQIDLLIREGYKKSQIAICSLRGREEASAMGNRSKLGSHRLVRADDDSAPTELIADTVSRLKGLERPVVIVTDTHLLSPDHFANASELGRRLYVAATRAEQRLILIGPSLAKRAPSAA